MQPAIPRRAGALTSILQLAGALAVALPAAAAPLVDDVRLISDSTSAALAAPAPQTFTVTQAGTYTVQLTDLDTPSSLSALSVAVASSAATATRLDAPGGNASMDVLLAAGQYTVQPLATAAGASAGSFAVTVTSQGTMNPLFQHQWAVAANAAAQPTGQSTLSTSFTVTDGGSYQLTVTDRSFPAALNGLQLLLAAGSTPLCNLTLVAGSASCNATLAAGSSYDLFIVAQGAAPAYAGAYSVKIVGGSSGSTTAYGATLPVGALAQPIGGITVPVTESVTVEISDLGLPATLVSAQALVAQGGDVLQTFPAAGTATFTSPAGSMQVFTLAQADAASGEGALAIYVSDAGGALADVAVPVTLSGHYGYVFAHTIGAAGTYQFSATDFQLPSPLPTLHTLVEQRGAPVANGLASAVPGLQPGVVNMLAFATVGGAPASGLFGIDLTGPNGSEPPYEITQGVGAAFRSTTVDIVASGGSYVANLTDLGFPANFSQVWFIGTRGQSVVAQIIGSNHVSFNVPSSGTYVINVLAQVGAGQHYGLYGFNLAPAPPAPVVSLNASASSVVSGGHVTLTWSATDATGCTASDGWSGMLAASGSQDSAALTATTTFTLTCNGDGGAGSAQVTVQVTQPPSSSGGGGALGAGTVCMLALAVAAALRRRILQAD